MPGERRTNEQMMADDVTISELYLAGHSQGEIAEQIGKSQPTVSRAIARIHQRWLESPLINFDEAKRRELAVIDKVESEAWAAWYASQEPATEKTTEGGKVPMKSGKETVYVSAPSKARIKTTERDGERGFLDIVLKCVKQRSDLLGLVVQRSEQIQPGEAAGVDSYAGMFKLMGKAEKARQAN